MKDMSAKEKASYIYEYYKIHIIVVILVISFIGYFIHIQVTRVDEIFNVTFMGNYDDTKRIGLQDQITKILGEVPGGKRQATVGVLPFISGSGDNSAIEQKLYVQTATNQLDLVVMDKTSFDRYSKQGMFTRLDTNHRLDKLRSISTNGDGPYGKYGWNIKNKQSIAAIKTENGDKIIGIVSSSKRTAQAEKVLEWILNNK